MFTLELGTRSRLLTCCTRALPADWAVKRGLVNAKSRVKRRKCIQASSNTQDGRTRTILELVKASGWFRSEETGDHDESLEAI